MTHRGPFQPLPFCDAVRGRKHQCNKIIPERKRQRKAEIEEGPSPLEKQKTASQESPVSRHHPFHVRWPLVVHPANLH